MKLHKNHPYFFLLFLLTLFLPLSCRSAPPRVTVVRRIRPRKTVDPTKQLIIAVEQENLSAVRYWISRGADVNAIERSLTRMSPLGTAVRTNSLPLVSLLLNQGADPNRPANADGIPPLSYAALYEADSNIMKRLLQNGADPNKPIPATGETALHIAVGTHSLPAVKLLIAFGADFYRTDNRGISPVQIAAANYFPDILNYFSLEEGTRTIYLIPDVSVPKIYN